MLAFNRVSKVPAAGSGASFWLRLRIGHRRLVVFVRSLSLANARVPRLAWFRLKRALRISTHSDRAFLVDEFIRRVQAGDIGRRCHITAERGDGAGAQVHAKMAAFALAKTYGLAYAHSPFRTMDHAEGPPDAWAAAWEAMLNLGHQEIGVAECRLPRVGIEDFMADRRWWSLPCVLSADHFARLSDQRPDVLQGVVPQLRAKYHLGSAPKSRSGVVEIGAHLRRGDVSVDDPGTAGRFVSADVMAESIEQVRSVINDLGLRSRVRLFSQGSESEFAAFRDMGCELCVSMSALTTFREMVDADILIMSKSSLGYVAAVLNDGVKIYDRYARRPMPTWVERDGRGRADPAQLRASIEALVRYRFKR